MLESIAELTLGGMGGSEIAHTGARVATGAFFAISGWNKLFHPGRHQSLRKTLEESGIPLIRFNEWFVPSVELSAGAALVLGLATLPAALGLLVICLVACAVDGISRIKSWSPINRADWIDDLLYLPEVLYAILLVYFITQGAGDFSLDAMILASL